MREWRALRLRLVATHGPAATFGPIARARHDRYINGWTNGHVISESGPTCPFDCSGIIVEGSQLAAGDAWGLHGISITTRGYRAKGYNLSLGFDDPDALTSWRDDPYILCGCARECAEKKGE